MGFEKIFHFPIIKMTRRKFSRRMYASQRITFIFLLLMLHVYIFIKSKSLSSLFPSLYRFIPNYKENLWIFINISLTHFFDVESIHKTTFHKIFKIKVHTCSLLKYNNSIFSSEASIEFTSSHIMMIIMIMITRILRIELYRLLESFFVFRI